MRLLPSSFCLVLTLGLSFAGCGDDDGPLDGGSSSPDAADARTSGFLGACIYTNTFSDEEDCREYTGTDWTMESAATDCETAWLGRPGVLSAGACNLASEIGRCDIGDINVDGYVIVSSGDSSACGSAEVACTAFAGGTFVGADSCTSCTPSDEIGQPFIPAYVDCRPPISGEEPGMSEGGEICTWTIISGSTEPGRRYADYADCDAVRTQRPYYAQSAGVEADPMDPRLSDSAYMGEVEWLREQAESSACSCCHTSSETPEGAAIWDTEGGDLWVDTISDEALAMLGGYTDSAAFGFLPSEENNGFDRATNGLPTTDRPRLIAFIEAELARREITPEQAAELEPFAPFFRELIEFEPEACEDGIGIDEDGALTWVGGGARYIHVLAADSQAPGVPPNWDLPPGTLWAVSVPPDELELGCGIAYGELPATAVQRVPESGAPPALVSGESYFLHVQRDIALPIARCLFTAP